MSLFSKASSSDPDRRLADEPLDGNYGRTLPLLQRVFIRVLVSEMRKMLDERDGRVHGVTGLPRPERPDMDGNRADRIPAAYRDRDEPEGSGIAGR